MSYACTNPDSKCIWSCYLTEVPCGRCASIPYQAYHEDYRTTVLFYSLNPQRQEEENI